MENKENRKEITKYEMRVIGGRQRGIKEQERNEEGRTGKM